MKKRVSKRNINVTQKKVISVSYCGLWYLLSTLEPFAYSAGIYGWSCDYYHIPREICVSTGYSPIGKRVPYELCEQYEEAAKKICEETRWKDYDERRRRINALLEDFAGDIERRCFN